MAQRVHLITSAAPLLSGSLDQCLGPNDESCFGGVAAAAAFGRAYSQGEPSFFLPFLDRESPFVQMSPLGWSVNRFIYEYLCDAKAFLGPPSLLQQHKADSDVSQRDLSNLQSKRLPFLLSNVQVPLWNSWNQYHVPLYLDRDTGLAVMAMVGAGEGLSTPPIDTSLSGLDYIARINMEAGCMGDYVDPFQVHLDQGSFTVNKTAEEDVSCWIPVIIFSGTREPFESLLQAVLRHPNPPALLLDVAENSKPLNVPTVLEGKTWLVSVGLRDERYQHYEIELSQDRKRVSSVNLITHDLNFTLPQVPPNARDTKYNNTIESLARLATEARDNDPVVAQSEHFKVQRRGTYRPCKGGQCEAGSLFMDAVQWYTGATIAFSNSGGYRGDGWSAGDVKISNIWDTLPFANNLCTGVMSGVSIFKAFNFSIAMATFESEDTVNGGLLLQVSSSMRLTFNTRLTGSRLISIEIWDEESNDFLPLERLKLYTFATDSFMCTGYTPYIDLLNSDLVFRGEQPGQLDTSIIVQEVVADYLRTLGDTVYQPMTAGRLINDTEAALPADPQGRTVLNLVQTEDSCANDQFWNEEEYTCVSCPDSAGVAFLKDTLEFKGEVGYSLPNQEISFVNTLSYNITVASRSLPFWIHFDGSQDTNSLGNRLSLEFQDLAPGEEVVLDVGVNASSLQPGTATGSAIFGVLNENQFPGCTRPDATFDMIVRIDPAEDLNQLGSVRIFGWVASGIIISSCLVLTGWVVWNRKTHIVRTLQPLFLVMISLGVVVMGCALIPLGFDDEIVSEEASGRACMAFPWLLSMGFTVAMSALFSKLWRINKLFQNSTLRRIRVTEKDVIAPFLVLFVVNFAALMTWTLVDPLFWERTEIQGQTNQSYGSCTAGDHPLSITMIVLVGVVNLAAFFFAGYQAFRARDVSDEFSESKNLGIALFSWAQLLLIGVPVLFLIDDDNPSARYFITAGLTFAVCMSMLLLIYIPILIQKRRAEQRLVMEIRVQDHPNSDATESRGSRPRSSVSMSSMQFSLKDTGKTRISGIGEKMQKTANKLKMMGDFDTGSTEKSAEHPHNQSNNSPFDSVGRRPSGAIPQSDPKTFQTDDCDPHSPITSKTDLTKATTNTETTTAQARTQEKKEEQDNALKGDTTHDVAEDVPSPPPNVPPTTQGVQKDVPVGAGASARFDDLRPKKPELEGSILRAMASDSAFSSICLSRESFQDETSVIEEKA